MPGLKIIVPANEGCCPIDDAFALFRHVPILARAPPYERTRVMPIRICEMLMQVCLPVGPLCAGPLCNPGLTKLVWICLMELRCEGGSASKVGTGWEALYGDARLWRFFSAEEEQPSDAGEKVHRKDRGGRPEGNAREWPREVARRGRHQTFDTFYSHPHSHTKYTRTTPQSHHTLL
ncbi:hypothetical protein BC830DRAFT_1126800 [Chytriomyces sp. MP71]|nr:hypothetical protein BC830DRAFT_1126800 [Chytriomyces sp. MP71]